MNGEDELWASRGRGGFHEPRPPARRSQKRVPVKYMGRADKTADRYPDAFVPTAAPGLEISGHMAAKTEANGGSQFGRVGRRQLQRPLPVFAGLVPVPGLVDHVPDT